jgi:hypothetical protein
MAEIALLGLLLAGAAYVIYRQSSKEKEKPDFGKELGLLEEPVVILPDKEDEPAIVILPPPGTPGLPPAPKQGDVPFVDEFHVNDEHIDTIRWMKERNKAKYGDEEIHLVPQVVEELPELNISRGHVGTLKFRVVSSPFPDEAARENLRIMAPLAGENALLPGTAEIYASIAKTGGLPAHISRHGSPQLEFTSHKFRILQGDGVVKGISHMMEPESYAIILYLYSKTITEIEVELGFKVNRVDAVYDERFRGRYVSAHPETGMIHWSLPVNVK